MFHNNPCGEHEIWLIDEDNAKSSKICCPAPQILVEELTHTRLQKLMKMAVRQQQQEGT